MTPRAMVAFVVLVGAPLIPLISTWKRLVFQPGAEAPVSVSRARVETIIITASFLLLLGGLVWSPVFGPDHSKRRLTIIYANLALVVAVCVASVFGSKRYRFPLGISSCIVALEWAYLAVVNSVV